MAVDVLYFAAARDAAGTDRDVLPAAPADVAGLRRALAAARPGLARLLPRCRIAVGQEFAGDADPVPEGAEVAVLPPVSGGAPAPFAVVDAPIVAAEVVAAVAGPDAGGIATFTGTVRDATHGRRVVRLEYEAYRGMAERKLAEIGEALAREHGARVAIVHRVGTLFPGDAAVVVACAAPHRSAALRACAECIERLKREVPIWKREVYEDGSSWVGAGP